jgi:hypothetical protein
MLLIICYIYYIKTIQLELECHLYVMLDVVDNYKTHHMFISKGSNWWDWWWSYWELLNSLVSGRTLPRIHNSRHAHSIFDLARN